jgi:starvation-inducible DNA-binding protein
LERGGPNFHEKHKFFEQQNQRLDEIIDDIAERIRSVGHYAPATLKHYLELTHITEQSWKKNTGEEFVHELLFDHEGLIIRMRQALEKISPHNDFGTTDFITSLMEMHEKMAWMLRAQLK